MGEKSRAFEDRFLSKIGKIDRREIRDYLAQLLSRKQFLETIFDHLNEGIIVTDPGLSIIYSNRMARQMLNWPKRRRFLGESLAERCPEGPLREILENMALRPRSIKGYECAFGSDGKRRIMLTAIPVPGLAEEGSGPAEYAESMWVILLQDVTERYRSIEEQSRSQRLASLALLTSGVAHEIKNPLNSLNIHAQILEKQAEASEGEGEELDRNQVRRAAGVILEETARLTRIVNEFIQAARPQRPALKPHSINRIVEDLVRVLRPECEQAGIELEFELDSDLPRLEIDSHQIFQALRNLVSNAIEAHQSDEAGASKSPTPTNGDAERTRRSRMIAVRTKLVGDSVAIEVADDGPGIANENVDRIFEPYYTTKFDGTGLGLMVVYRVVTEHGGTIHVDSRPGIGTRFIISLPLAERPVRLLERPPESAPTDVS